MKAKAAVLGLSVLLGGSQQALSWGDDGHKAVALIAQQCLTKNVKKKVAAMLAADTDNLTRHDIASEATWADKYRDENHRRDHYEQTKRWHFTDLELGHPDLTSACFGRKSLPSGTLASNGDKMDCAVDKIEQFEAELAAQNTDSEERLLALKFILHFVGDLHQPMHSSDNDDQGGNQVKVIVDGFPHHPKDELHGFWDTQFVDAIAEPPTVLAKELLAEITPSEASEWATGTPEGWAMEAFKIALVDSYGDPPLSKDGVQHLDKHYVEKAEEDVRMQLKRAGIRLAFILNKSLGSEQADWKSCLASPQ